MPGTPRRAKRSPRPGSKFPSQILADNLKAMRARRNLSQTEVASRMADLDHDWSQTTVGRVERGDRNINIDEFFGLCLALGATPAELLDNESGGPVGLDPGGEAAFPFRPDAARRWILGESRYGFLEDLVEEDLSEDEPRPTIVEFLVSEIREDA